MWHERLRDLREDKDLTQSRVAEYLGCSQRVYCNYEHGETNIPIEYLIKLALLYNTSIDYLVGLTDTRKPYKRR